ncbi:MAG: FAS1-like dehydratase domain-containing protein [Longimicrobiales bacterium]
MSDWVPQPRTLVDTITPWPVRAMRGLLDQEPVAAEGDELPLGWHWLFFKELVRASKMGADGHPKRGTFLPPLELPRRMWAGGSLVAHKPVVIGEPAELRSRVTDVVEKEGRSGPLVFVTVGHEVHQGGLAVEEVQTLVYRGDDEEGTRAPSSSPAPPPAPVAWSEDFAATPVMLFQFSALTYNAHRIHYDHPYVTEHEGYDGLLVHAPLTALALLDACGRHQGPTRSYRYRATAPLFADQPVRLMGRGPDAMDPETFIAEAVADSGQMVMRGRIG